MTLLKSVRYMQTIEESEIHSSIFYYRLSCSPGCRGLLGPIWPVLGRRQSYTSELRKTALCTERQFKVASLMSPDCRRKLQHPCNRTQRNHEVTCKSTNANVDTIAKSHASHYSVKFQTFKFLKFLNMAPPTCKSDLLHPAIQAFHSTHTLL